MSFLPFSHALVARLLDWRPHLLRFRAGPHGLFDSDVLPNTHLAGNLVGRALGKLHWIAIISGIVFLISSLVYSRFY